MPERVQIKRTKGWRMPQNTVKVDRTTRWGNPFHVTPERDNAEAVRLFSELIHREQSWTTVVRGITKRVTLDEVRRELAGRNLACWCRPGLACHVDVLLKAANPSE